MREIKKRMQEAILHAIDSIRKDIQTDTAPDKNLTRAEAIKRLAEAYKSTR